MLQHHNFHLFQAYDEKLKTIRIAPILMSHIEKSLEEEDSCHGLNAEFLVFLEGDAALLYSLNVRFKKK